MFSHADDVKRDLFAQIERETGRPHSVVRAPVGNAAAVEHIAWRKAPVEERLSHALVKGIGPAAIAKNKELIRTDSLVQKGTQNPPAKTPARR